MPSYIGLGLKIVSRLCEIINPYNNAMAENFFSILKTERIYRLKPSPFAEANKMMVELIHFYNHEHIQAKTGVAPLTLRHSA